MISQREIGCMSIFSAVKRRSGESVVSRSRIGLIAEAIQRFWSYNVLRGYGINKASVMG
jgi:hypothetical protein